MEENEGEKQGKRSKSEIIFTIKLVIIITSVLLGVFSIGIFIFNGAAAKPIIYLYPTTETEVTVELGNPEIITCSYPKYQKSWNVLAKPSGDLVDLNDGRNLYSLYWEGKNKNAREIKEGFCVSGNESLEFLEEKLDLLGLSDREANEFIIYWLPKMEGNKYNLIYFENSEEISEYMPLTITPNPDALIRVMMRFKAVDSYVNIPEQHLITPERKGFVAVEWGGTEIK